MGLFKDFKEDFSQAVNELVPGGETLDDNVEVDTLSNNVDVKSELNKLDGLLEQVKEEPVKPVVERPVVEQPVVKERVVEVKPEVKAKEESLRMDTMAVESNVVLDETSVITASTTLTGNLASAGSFDIQGTVNGNVSCNGKLVVTGVINGNSTSSEFFADVAKIEGEVVSTGTVKIGAGSVIIGNISATSAVIAGAVKGDIDVQGPVVVDTSAVIMGNIKSRSVQINNGAIIEGFCSQCYADVDVQGIFGK
ncbi:MAG: polymer-forming cytoskeletal protein [Agathobacter sp.]|nr:polymer-forming cytoskeletal protein [Agathobacter sp.]